MCVCQDRRQKLCWGLVLEMMEYGNTVVGLDKNSRIDTEILYAENSGINQYLSNDDSLKILLKLF